MKTFRHFRHALALLLVSVLLAGCNALPGENLQVEELLRAPRLSGDYGAVQTALNDWLGESAQLKYPMQGELLSPFLLQDLDGDGQQDAAVLYTTAQSTNVCIAILQRDDTGAWQVRQSVEGLADTVENVRLAQLRAGDDCQLVVGYVAAQGDHYLAVYAYNDGQLSTILEQSYEQYLVEDITGGGSQDLILMSTQEDGGVQIELHDEECARQFRAEVVSDRDEPVEQLPDALKVIICVRKLHEALVVIVLRFFHHVFEDAAFAVERGVKDGAGDTACLADVVDGHVVISVALKEGNGCFRDFLFEFPGRILHFKHP